MHWALSATDQIHLSFPHSAQSQSSQWRPAHLPRCWKLKSFYAPSTKIHKQIFLPGRPKHPDLWNNTAHERTPQNTSSFLDPTLAPNIDDFCSLVLSPPFTWVIQRLFGLSQGNICIAIYLSFMRPFQPSRILTLYQFIFAFCLSPWASQISVTGPPPLSTRVKLLSFMFNLESSSYTIYRVSLQGAGSYIKPMWEKKQSPMVFCCMVYFCLPPPYPFPLLSSFIYHFLPPEYAPGIIRTTQESITVNFQANSPLSLETTPLNTTSAQFSIPKTPTLVSSHGM